MSTPSVFIMMAIACVLVVPAFAQDVLDEPGEGDASAEVNVSAEIDASADETLPIADAPSESKSSLEQNSERMALPPQYDTSTREKLPETADPESVVSITVHQDSIDQESTKPEDEQQKLAPEQTYQSLHQDYQYAFQDGEFAEAVIVARRMLQMVESLTGPNDIRLFEPLVNLASAQRRANQPEASVANYERAILLVEIESGIFDMRLIEPLQEVGGTFRATARNDDALDNYRRAQHLTHRQDGVMTIEQEEILDGITETYLAMGMLEEANQEQILSLRTYEHAFGRSDVRIVPAIHKLARFQMRIGQYRHARELYQRSLYLMEQNYEENDIRKLEPLEGIAMTRRSRFQGPRKLGAPGPGLGGLKLSNAHRSQGTDALERSLEIVDSRDDIDSEDRVTTLLNLADWRIEGNKPGEAEPLYKRAWDTWVEGGKSIESVQQYFARPRQLAYSPPSLPTEGESGRYVNYDGKFVEIEFTVTASGETRDLVVVDSNSPVVMHRKMRDTMKLARYRPALIDGLPVDTQGVRFRQMFSGTADIWRKP